MPTKLLKGCIAASTILFSVASTQAADTNGKFAVRGIGTTSCKEFSDALAARGNITPYAQWLLGYVSASNRYNAQTFDVLPTPQGSDMVGVVAAVCRTQPTQAIEAAAFQAIRALGPLRMAKESPYVAVSNGTVTLQVRSDAVLLLQNALIRKKFFKGPANGQGSADLGKAIKTFQEKEGLSATGVPDIDTFVRAVIKP